MPMPEPAQNAPLEHAAPPTRRLRRPQHIPETEAELTSAKGMRDPRLK